MKLLANTIIENIYRLELLRQHRETSVYIATEFHHILKTDNTSIINDVFNDIDFNMLCSWSLVCMLRITLNSKYKIDRWNNMLLFTKNYLDNNGFDSVKELHGLNYV